MWRQLTKHTMTGMAVLATAMLVTGCEAQVWGMPPGAGDTPQAPVTAPQAPMPALPQAPNDEPLAPFEGLDARTRQATSDAAKSGVNIKVAVLDRNTGEIISNNAGQPFPIASVVKLFIADDLLLQESKGEKKLTAADRASLDVMLRSSDDGAAQTFWDRNGGNAIIARIVGRYGLTGTTAPYNGHWDVTQSTANDLVRYYNMLLDGSGGLPPEQADVIMSNLAQSTPTGNDGYPQRFGIPEGLYAEPVAVKQGWFCCWNGGNQLHVSTGAIGPDRRYVMAISSLEPGDAASARNTVTQVVKTMFPGGRI
ncbi:serine hydrolase family protein [Mycolicibacterium neworleansense]|uniref:Beta-lactamase n=1 Tax=Mycolicibacterium neworleansense TaxID=146018 RepID=A0A0H5RT00_9MYCO|nr:serine hydrolase [Mycolicibacterium neworleansense]MCV7360117.1 serine hydrolase [Mycolicibacterium neworleansense]CRZ17280.1 beta-lactamase [Mycolicibacterium neworleansense]